MQGAKKNEKAHKKKDTKVIDLMPETMQSANFSELVIAAEPVDTKLNTLMSKSQMHADRKEI